MYSEMILTYVIVRRSVRSGRLFFLWCVFLGDGKSEHNDVCFVMKSDALSFDCWSEILSCMFCRMLNPLSQNLFDVPDFLC